MRRCWSGAVPHPHQRPGRWDPPDGRVVSTTIDPLTHPFARIDRMDVHDDEQEFTELVLFVADRLRSDRSGGGRRPGG
jgi:hypothetical protein